MAGALFVLFAGGFVLLRAPVSGRLPVVSSLARVVPMPGGVLPPAALDRTWYVQTDSSVYFAGSVSGRFSDVRGQWTVDAEAPQGMAASIHVGIASVETQDGALDATLRSPQWLDEDRYHDLTVQLAGMSGWPSVVRRSVAYDLGMDGRVSVRGVVRDVPWRCAMEADVHWLRLHCTGTVTLGEFGLAPGPAPVALTAEMDFADRPA